MRYHRNSRSTSHSGNDRPVTIGQATCSAVLQDMETTLNSTLVDEYAALLPSGMQRQSFLSNVQHLQHVADESQDLSAFLTSYATLVADLYAASAVAIWFAKPKSSLTTGDADSASVVRKAAVGWANLAFDQPSELAHQRLIEYAIGQSASLAVQPFSAPALKSGVSNPTDSFLLLAPSKYQGREVAVVEIALGPKPLRRPHQELMQAYVAWATWLSAILQQGIERCFEPADQRMQLALAQVQATTNAVEAIQQQIRATIQASLTKLTGQNFGSLTANQAITSRVHELLDSKALRLKCTECGTAAILRCQNAGNSKTGAFMFDHYLDSGRTFHGGSSTFPEVEVVSKPPRRKAKSGSASKQ